MNQATLNSAVLNGLTTSGSVNSNFIDEFCSVSVSGYNWLTPALITAQQQFAVRPYYTCQIIDDSLSNVSQTLINNPTRGSAVTAPDGTILAVGLDASNNVGFWKITNGADLTQWNAAPTVILENNAHNRDLRNHYAIKVSDYIAGTYKIDVYFFGNFDNNSGSGVLSIIHYYSLDGGATWTNAGEAVNDTLIATSATTQNIWVSAGRPYQDDAGNIISTVFYLELDGATAYDIVYQQYLGTGTTFNTAVPWATKEINTGDWMLHSFDNVLINGYFYIVFSGYHQFYDPPNQVATTLNYNIYVTQIKQLTNDVTKDIWSQATVIISALSSSPQNLNTFIYPQCSYIDGVLYTIFLGDVVSSIVQTTTTDNNSVSVSNNLYISQSVDFLNFSYLAPIMFPDGTEFTDLQSNSIFNQGVNFYIAGNLQLATLLKNNIVADVSNDILNYTIDDTQQSASTFSLTIGNANNKWYAGTPPTQSGYQAIAKNRKVNIMQGYYTSLNTTEVAPRDIFYIDDITQNVSSNANDFTLTGRNLYKNLKVLTTKFAYTFDGIHKYVDVFDGSTTQNYKFVNGDWTVDAASNTIFQNSAVAGERAVAVLGLYQESKPNTIMSLYIHVATSAFPTSQENFYFYYIDQQNYACLLIEGATPTGFNVVYQTNVNGAVVNTFLKTISGVSDGYYPFYIVREGYYKAQFYVGSPTQNITAFDSPTFLGEADISGLGFTEVGSVAFGTIDNSTSSFRNFRYFQFDLSQNIEELIKTLATKASIFDYKMPNTFSDSLFDTANYIGAYTEQNRIMTIAPSGFVYCTAFEPTAAEIKFVAKVTPNDPTQNYGFDFYFRFIRAPITGDFGYHFTIQNQIGDAGQNFLSIKLYNIQNSVSHLIAFTGGVNGNYTNNLRFDLTKYNTFRVVYFGNYIFLMINDVVVFGYLDNNTDFLPDVGFIGFGTPANASLSVQSIVAPSLWNQIENYSFNPGDDLENSMDMITATIRIYYYSDLFGRLKAKKLSEDLLSDYTYQNQLVLQQVDNSDKEYVNQITVNGLNVSAVARDTVSIGTTGAIRELVISDYKITTYQDALIRAEQELIDANKFNGQLNPKQVLNVGAELYEAVHVINTGANSSDIDEVVRVYSQEIQVGGNNIQYWLQLGTGTL